MSEIAKLEWRGVTRSFGSKHVLNGIDLVVAPKTSMVVIGGSGTGKSVLIKTALGILPPDNGDIYVDGTEISRLHEEARAPIQAKLGMLFQGAALFDSFKVWENVAFALIQGGAINREDAKALAIQKLAKVGLGPDTAMLQPSELSGGMQKRVGLARAIAADPEIIFFDEPTTGLDPIMADVINELIVELVEDLGATAISITHDMASVRKIADQVAMIYDGKIIWTGPVDAIDDSGNPFVDQFVHGRAQGPIKMQVAV